MPGTANSNYSDFDHPDILSVLFHPRRDVGRNNRSSTLIPVTIPVDDGETVGAMFHLAGPNAPTILFFHGNGEIVSDYDDIGHIFIAQGINLFVVDYRGYGFSSGAPTVSSMMADCQIVFDYVKQWLSDYNGTGKLIVMGRSLGSASALELAAERADAFDGLIIESGFAYALPLLRLMGLDPDRLGVTEEKGFRNIDKAARCQLPLLVIHAEHDHIIPFSDGRAIYEQSPAVDKSFVTIHQADHNTIFFHGMEDYIAGIKVFIERLDG